MCKCGCKGSDTDRVTFVHSFVSVSVPVSVWESLCLCIHACVAGAREDGFFQAGGQCTFSCCHVVFV